MQKLLGDTLVNSSGPLKKSKPKTLMNHFFLINAGQPPITKSKKTLFVQDQIGNKSIVFCLHKEHLTNLFMATQMESILVPEKCGTKATGGKELVNENMVIS